MDKILWIASYPKSGNTLVRSIISSLIYSKDGIFNFPILENLKQFDINFYFEFIKEINQEDYKNLNRLEVVSKYWELAQKHSYQKENRYIFKTHAANLMFKNFKYTDENRTLGLIYILRDPRDITVSYSKFRRESIDSTINLIKNKNAVLYNSQNKIIVPLSSWDVHIESWNLLKVPKYIVRYEDIINNREKFLIELINFLQNKLKINLIVNEEKISNILKTTSFDQLQKNESKTGYYAFNHIKDKEWQFFRKGIAGQWKQDLSSEQVSKINNLFNSSMKKFGYI